MHNSQLLATAGAPAADLEETYQRYGHRVYNFMRYRTGDDDAQELTQMVFERVLLHRHRYDPAKGNFEVWLFTIARNILNDHYRKGSRAAFAGEDALAGQADPAATPEERLLAGEQRRMLGRALEVLSRRELTVVSLKYAGGLRNTEIARVMRLSEKNAGVILHRSLKKLRNAMEKEMEA